MLLLSSAEVKEFFEHRVWREVVRKLQQDMEIEDHNIEAPEPFFHGVAVGSRRKLKWFIHTLPGIMEVDAEKREHPTGAK